MNRFLAQWRPLSKRATLLAGLAFAAVPLVTLCLPASAGAAPATEATDGPQSLLKTEITVATPDGDRKFTVEVAITDEQREKGLMFRQSMDQNAGMIFLYKTPTVLRMWMKNTTLPLDMVFIGADNRIVAIRPRAVPYSLSIISSEVPAKDVIELNGGAADRFGLAVGQEVKGIPSL